MELIYAFSIRDSVTYTNWIYKWIKFHTFEGAFRSLNKIWNRNCCLMKKFSGNIGQKVFFAIYHFRDIHVTFGNNLTKVYSSAKKIKEESLKIFVNG